MDRNRGQYVADVLAYLKREIEELNGSLPAKFSIGKACGPQSDWKLGVEIDSDQKGWFDYFDALTQLGQRANEKFKEDKWFFGIELLVPDRLVGTRGLEHLQAQHQQKADNDNFRHVRLRKNNG